MEAFLYFIWQGRLFGHDNLHTEQGERLEIIHPGFHNNNAGADFQQARLRINGLDWAGAVEIHWKSSDWHRHNHQHNTAYDGVVLHVVWQHDTSVFRQDTSEVPTLALQSRTDPRWLPRYQGFIANKEPLACGPQFRSVDGLYALTMLERAATQRLEAKAAVITEILSSTQNNWEETAYQALARSFGFKTNTEPMAQLARTVPFKLLQKYGALQTEALLFGAAGFLEAPATDSYTEKLQKEYAFLAEKHQLPSPMPLHAWKFARMRPANFPTVRLAQFALCVRASLMGMFLSQTSPESYLNAWGIPPESYWQTHYAPGKKASKTMGKLGKESIQSLLINAVVPLLVAYSQYKGEPRWLTQATDILEALPPEKNSFITDTWEQYGLALKSAFDTQGAIGWFQDYCQPRACLRCEVGRKVLNYS